MAAQLHIEILEDSYRLLSDLVIRDTGITGHYYEDGYAKLWKDGTLTIKAGYSWDGRSGPAIDTADALRSSCAHDTLYRLIRIKALPYHYRKRADKLMRRLDKEDGVGAFRRWYSYWGLRFFGGNAI